MTERTPFSQLIAAALRSTDLRAMRRTAEILDEIKEPVPGCEHLPGREYWPYYDTARKVEDVLVGMEQEAGQ